MLRRANILLILGCLLAPGCDGRHDATERVVLRLRAPDFGRASTAHPPMLAIDRTAREVIALPQRDKVGIVDGALFADGVAHVDLDAFSMPAGAALELTVHALSMDTLVHREIRNQIAIGARFVRLEEGWRLARTADGRGRLTIERKAVEAAVSEEQDTSQVLTRLYVRRPLPSRLTSRAFDLPPDAQIELPFGVLGTPGTDGRPPPVDMVATLRCGDHGQVLLRTTVAPGESPPGWRTVRAALPASRTPCALELAQEDAAGNPSAFVVWGAPQIFTATRDAELRIVLISLDTLRADHLSGYGYPRRTTPEIDRRLIDGGVRFADVSTTISSTGIAHLSLFTGLFPREQRTPGRLRAHDPTQTLAETLQAAGFTTAAVTEDGLIAGPFGFWFGFDSFREYPVVAGERGARVFRDGISFLRDHRRGRFFLFLHTYKVHDPWVIGAGTADRFRDDPGWSDGTLDARIPGSHRHLVDAYDRTIVEVDGMVAGFLDELDRLGLADDTLVVLVADHGEAFGEHGLFGHGLGVGQEQLHIPLVFRGPGVGVGLIRHAPVGITDVASTIIDLAGASRPKREGPVRFGSGRSLAALVRADDGDTALAPEPLYFTWLLSHEDGIRLGPKKLVTEGARCREYDLERDPRERRSALVPCERSELARRLDAYRVAAARSSATSTAAALDAEDTSTNGAAEPATVSPDVEKTLRALGYVR